MRAFRPPDGAFLRYIEVPGQDPPLLWLHGWQCASTGELLPSAVQEPLQGRRSLMIDFLGHGYSDKPLDFPYTVEDHARTIVALIDALGIADCGLVGHSMGGQIAIHVAAARPRIVSMLVMAEGAVDAHGEEVFDGQTEDEFVDHGFASIVEEQTKAAEEQPTGIPAAHVGMTRLIEPRALYREEISMRDPTDPPTRSLLLGLQAPRWYLQGALSDPDPVFQEEMSAAGVTWVEVPDTGHPMGLQNPYGLAAAVAEAAASTWPE